LPDKKGRMLHACRAGQIGGLTLVLNNGNQLLLGVGGRSLWARRCRDLYAAFIADAGGAETISEAKSAILRRAAVITTELERREAAFARDGQVTPEDLDQYAKQSAVLSRLLDVTPKTIEQFVAEIAAEKAARIVAPATPVTLEIAPTAPTPVKRLISSICHLASLGSPG
jgi:hypothetical protein